MRKSKILLRRFLEYELFSLVGVDRACFSPRGRVLVEILVLERVLALAELKVSILIFIIKTMTKLQEQLDPSFHASITSKTLLKAGVFTGLVALTSSWF